jgi:DGQHR domain-containing protein
MPQSDIAPPKTPKRAVSFGRIAYPAIGYMMGTRRMVSTVMSPVSFIGTVGDRESWDPLSGSGTNRKEDRKHREGIAQYLEETEDYVLNAILVYMGTQDATFEPDDPEAAISPGVLYTRPGAKFKVGDGGHRTSAFGDVIQGHAHGDDVLERFMVNGQPIIVVLDDDQGRRAQDFTDLQNNAKPLNASIAQSMDRRQAINRLLLEQVIKTADIPLLDGGRRVEFLTDSPGKLSAKITGFKSLRYASGTLLVGTDPRSTRTWDDAVALALVNDEEGSLQAIVDFWTGYGELPDVAAALDKDTMPTLRDKTWLASANVMYAIAAAVHEITAGSDATVAETMAALAGFDFRRAGKALHGTLVEPAKVVKGQRIAARALTGRDAWEGAAAVLIDHLTEELGLVQQA